MYRQPTERLQDIEMRTFDHLEKCVRSLKALPQLYGAMQDQMSERVWAKTTDLEKQVEELKVRQTELEAKLKTSEDALVEEQMRRF
jgi:cell division protein FtsB